MADRYVCRACLDDLCDRLHGVRALVEDLFVALSRQARVAADQSGIKARSAERPLPFAWPAAEALSNLDGTLTVWAHTLADTHQLTVDPPPEYRPTDLHDPARVYPRRHRATATAAWLAGHTHLVATHPDAETFLDEIDYALRDSHRVIDRPPELRYCGPCGADTEDDDGHPLECEGELYAWPTADTVTCRDCGAEHDVGVRHAWLLDQVQDQLVTAAEASRALPGLLGRTVTASTVRGLAHRGTLTRHPPLPGTTSTLYRLGDVVDALVADRADQALTRGNTRHAG